MIIDDDQIINFCKEKKLSTENISILRDIYHKTVEYEKMAWLIPDGSFGSYAKRVNIKFRINSIYLQGLKDENGNVYKENELASSKQAAYHLAFQKFPHAKFLIERAYES